MPAISCEIRTEDGNRLYPLFVQRVAMVSLRGQVGGYYFNTTDEGALDFLNRDFEKGENAIEVAQELISTQGLTIDRRLDIQPLATFGTVEFYPSRNQFRDTQRIIYGATIDAENSADALDGTSLGWHSLDSLSEPELFRRPEGLALLLQHELLDRSIRMGSHIKARPLTIAPRPSKNPYLQAYIDNNTGRYI